MFETCTVILQWFSSLAADTLRQNFSTDSQKLIITVIMIWHVARLNPTSEIS